MVHVTGGQAESDSLGGRFIGSQGEVFLHVILARADIYILESVAKSSQTERLMHILKKTIYNG